MVRRDDLDLHAPGARGLSFVPPGVCAAQARLDRPELLVSHGCRKVAGQEVARGKACPAHGQDTDGRVKIGEPESEMRWHDQVPA